MKIADVAIVFVLCLCGFAAATPELYFADADGNSISQMQAVAGRAIAIYIYGSTDEGNTYDYFNLGVAYDPVSRTPMTGTATLDLVMSTSTTFGAPFGHQEVTYHDMSLLSAAASSISGPPAGFGPTLLATVYFTFNGTPASVSMFNEADDYTYSTFYLDTNTFGEMRFTDILAITPIPEPTTIGLLTFAVVFLKRKIYNYHI